MLGNILESPPRLNWVELDNVSLYNWHSALVNRKMVLLDCRGMMEKYLNQTGNEGKTVSEGAYQLKDRYHGDLDLFWKGRMIWGILDLNDPELQSKFLKAFEDPGKQ
jgi:hypothetical protein